MHCRRCEEDFFGGSICPRCGGALRRGAVIYSRVGEPLAHRISPHGEGSERAHEEREPGHSEGLVVRLMHKMVESVLVCALFSVIFRISIFLLKVIDSLMKTGGDIYEGIRLGADMHRPVEWYETMIWMLIVFLVFRFRHNPR